MAAVMYCECQTPVMDIEHDEGCRRCGRPVDFSPPPLRYFALPSHYTIGDRFDSVEAAAQQAALRLCRFKRENETEGRFNPYRVAIDERETDNSGDRPVRRMYLSLTESQGEPFGSGDLTGVARALYEAIEAAMPDDLTVEGTIQTDETDFDHCRPELDRAFDLIDEVLQAITAYERSKS